MTLVVRKMSATLVKPMTSRAAASAAVVVFFVASDAHAAGTALDVQSARGTGMAAAVTAMVDDSSAVYYNPAGIAQGRIVDAQIGDSLILPTFRFKPTGGSSSTSSFEVVPPFSAYLSGGVTDHFSIGIGVFEPYGSTVTWPDEWVGKSQVTSVQFATYDINPTVAYQFGPLRVGAGLQIVRATVDLKQKIETGSTEASSEIGADAWGVGANAGIQMDLIKRYLSIGAHYRSAVKLDFNGNSHFGNVPPELQSSLHDQAVKASFINPDSLALAVASHPIPRLVLDAEVVWFGWSKFHSIDIRFPNDASGTLSRSEPKNWTNEVNYRIGGELAVDQEWRVRAGVLYDPSPSPASTLAPDVPDADRLNLALGGSYVHASGFRVDLGYQFLVLFSRTSTAPQLPGRYSGLVDIVGLSVGYRTPEHPRAPEEVPALSPAESHSPPATPPTPVAPAEPTPAPAEPTPAPVEPTPASVPSPPPAAPPVSTWPGTP
jgi:long-chain fatty acid transport protein